MNGKNCESAVSETIGVTLAVALTVILAAIVAAYLFGMIPSLPTTHSIALVATQVDSDTITIVYHGGPDQKSLASMNITWPSGIVELVPQPKVGTTYTAINRGGIPNVTAGQDHIVVAGDFGNGVHQVILETFV